MAKKAKASKDAERDAAASERVLAACASIASLTSTAVEQATDSAAPFLSFAQRSRIRAMGMSFETGPTGIVVRAPAPSRPSPVVTSGDGGITREEIDAIVAHRVEIALTEALQRIGVAPDSTIQAQIDGRIGGQISEQENRILDYVRTQLTDSLRVFEERLDERLGELEAARREDEVEEQLEQAREDLLKNIDEVRTVDVSADQFAFAAGIVEVAGATGANPTVDDEVVEVGDGEVEVEGMAEDDDLGELEADDADELLAAVDAADDVEEYAGEVVALEEYAGEVEALEEVEAEPMEVEAESMEVEAEPVEVEAEPMEVEAEPMEVEAEPVEVEAEPMEVEAEPMEVEAEPMEVEAEEEIVEVEAEPMEVEAEPMEVEAEPVEIEAVEQVEEELVELDLDASGALELSADDEVAADDADEVEVEVAADDADEVEVEVAADDADEVEVEVAADDADEVEVEVAADDADEVEVEVAADDADEVEVEVAADDADEVEVEVAADDAVEIDVADEVEVEADDAVEIDVGGEIDESVELELASGETAAAQADEDDDEYDLGLDFGDGAEDEDLEELSVIRSMPDEEAPSLSLDESIELDPASLDELADNDVGLGTLGTGPDEIQIVGDDDEEESDFEVEIDEDDDGDDEGDDDARSSIINKYMDRALQMGARQQFTPALELYSKVLELDGKHFDALVSRGVVYSKTKDYRKATEDFRRAQEIAPDRAGSYYGLAELHYNRRQFNKAIKNYNQALERDDQLAEAYCRRGLSYYYLKNYKVAFHDLYKAYDINPDLPKIRSFLKLVQNKIKESEG